MNLHRCLLCVDGMMPAGIHPVFGPVYRICPCCHTLCLSCDGRAVFPASGGYASELLFTALYTLGYDTDCCRACLGITNLWPPDTDLATVPQLPDITVYIPTHRQPSTQDNDADTIHRAEKVLRTIADRYYADCQTYAHSYVNNRTVIRARMNATAAIGDMLADALGIAAPDWEAMRELATDHPDPGVSP
ncbi:hypothetical protein [Phytohabitans kaempferiae]|uniref:Uncharacterized protein n=1 Tax=Phytohabitans kaempferiae TaxID=1620943 RepID=A0ABV6M0I4_9ACTN